MEVFKSFELVGREYIISNKGRVINSETGYELTGEITAKGYRRYWFRNRKLNISKNKFCHTLVAELFIENPNNYTEINHIDYNPLNNNIENLEWCTRSMNIKHTFLRPERNHKGNNNPNSKFKQSNKLKNRDNQQPSSIEI